MPFQAWIPTHLANEGEDFSWLQWGHALSGMDTTRNFCHSYLLFAVLQWGHALSGMDT